MGCYLYVGETFQQFLILAQIAFFNFNLIDSEIDLKNKT